MSNEQVILEMIVNRITQLLENEDLKSKWGAELTEIMLLGQGVIIDDGLHDGFERGKDGRWILPLNEPEINFLVDLINGSINIDDFDESVYTEAETVAPLQRRISDLFSTTLGAARPSIDIDNFLANPLVPGVQLPTVARPEWRGIDPAEWQQ